jgi:hypothetical protein
MMKREWKKLGAVPPTDFVEERLQLHWACQPLSSAAQAAMVPLPGDSHTNLGWDHERGALTTQPFPSGHVAELRMAEFTLHWCDAKGVSLDLFALEGETLEAANGWLAEKFPDVALKRRDYEMPEHPVMGGEPFTGGARAKREELASWFATADIALTEVALATPGASSVRTWPHHFDSGSLIVFEPDKDPEEALSIGIGMSPGDPLTAQPYYYVIPYPRPKDQETPSFPSGGVWERDRFYGAMLTGEALLGSGEAAGQEGQVRSFLAAAINECARQLKLGDR